MTIFNILLRTEQQVIFDLIDVYADLYTGPFTVILEALSYRDEYVPGLTPADHIYPISTLIRQRISLPYCLHW